MINPDDRVPQDDTDDEDKEDQMSQNDIHSNGFDEYDEPLDDDNVDESAALNQAYKAAESSYTLDFEDEDEDDDE
jgi:hypothetical protein